MTTADTELQKFRQNNLPLFDPREILHSSFPENVLSRRLVAAWGKGALAGMQIERKAMEDLAAQSAGESK